MQFHMEIKTWKGGNNKKPFQLPTSILFVIPGMQRKLISQCWKNKKMEGKKICGSGDRQIEKKIDHPCFILLKYRGLRSCQ